MIHAQRCGISYTVSIIKAQQKVYFLELGVDEKILLKLTSNK
jgi:hypothetical protein